MNLEMKVEKKLENMASKMSISKLLFGVFLFFVFVVTSSNTHVIKDTEVGVVVNMGEIMPDVKSTGLAFTVPFVEDIRRIDTTERKKEYTGISLATRADAASPATGNIVITYAISGSEAPAILEEFGTIERFIDTRLNQPMLSKARIAASAIEDTRTLMTPEARNNLGRILKEYLDASHTGYNIQDVMVQSIIPHETIAKRINDAAQRAEDDVIEQHNLTLATSVAATAEAKARGEEEVANAASRAAAFKKRELADAEAHATLVKGAAVKQSMFDLADGNAKLNESLTDKILRKQELDNEAILFNKSQGNVPHTVIGKTDLRAYGFPTLTNK